MDPRHKAGLEKRIQVLLQGRKGGRIVTDAMRTSLEKFDRYNRRRTLTLSTRASELNHLVSFGLFLIDRRKEQYEEALEADFEGYQVEVPMSTNTKRVNVSVLKKFYWLLEGSGKGRRKVYPPKVDILERPQNDDQDFDPEKAPLYREMAHHVETVIAAMDHPRDRCILALTFDTGARRSELVDLKVGSLTLHREYGDVTLNGKTGLREVRFVRALPYVTTWLNMHPKPDRGAPLWVAQRRSGIQPVGIRGFGHIFQKAASVTGLSITPHDLRHGRATEAAQLGWNEDAMRHFFGWRPNSTMPSRYTHLAAVDIKQRVLRDAGLREEDPPEEKGLAPVRCIRCREVNEPTNRFCKLCGLALSLEAATEVEEIKEDLVALVERLVEEKLREGLAK